ncbi:MAG: 16S rRNA (guanine(527)-N(7))-methyltransferase RsmG [Solirubrobacteraceae bacterium]
MITERSRERLSELVEQHHLDITQHQQLGALLRALAGDEHAPTSAREPDLAVDVHLADSLSLLELDLPPDIAQVIDIGSGAGFPGLPIAIARTAWTVGLLESQARKCAFIDRTVQLADVGNARAIRKRAEEWTELAGQDLVLARALASQPVVLEYAAPLLGVGGMLVDWRGRRDPMEEKDAAEAAEVLGLRLHTIQSTKPFDTVLHRHLHVYRKIRETPERFPRRAGMALKRPLGSGSKRANEQKSAVSIRHTTSVGDRR